MLLNRAKRRFYRRENSFDLGNNILVPKKILSRLSGVFDVTQSIIKRLNNPSPPEIEFYKYFPQALKEIPFFIRNVLLWNKLCDRHGIPMNSPIRVKLYHQVDFLFLDSSFVVELDSIYHSGKEIEDLIRDKYLWEEYGIEVVRYWKTDFLNDLSYLSNRIKQIRPIQINNQNFSDEYFEVLYQNQIEKYYDLLIHNNYLRDSSKKVMVITTADLSVLNWVIEDIYSMSKWTKKYLGKKLIYFDINILSNDITKKYNMLTIDQQNILKQLGYL